MCFVSSSEIINQLLLSSSGVINLRPAGWMCPSQTFYATRHVVWEFVSPWRADIFCPWGTLISVRVKNRKKVLIKKYFCRCRPTTLKSRYCANVHWFVVQTICSLTKQYYKYCSINNWNFIKLKVTWYQTRLKAKSNLFEVNFCTEKYSYYPPSSEYQLYSC